MRLGEVLVASGWATSIAVDAALARQGQHGLRLGAILVALGAASPDDVARALARQRGVPAALERHFAQRDPALTRLLPAQVAYELRAVPMAWSRGAQGMSLVVCFRDPSPELREQVARVVGAPVIPAVACERVIDAKLTAAYGHAPAQVADAAAAVDVDFDEPSAPVLTLVELDDRGVRRDHSQAELVPPRTGPLLPATPTPLPAPRIPAPPPVAGPPAAVAPPSLSPTAAISALATATTRDAIADVAIAHARGAWGGAVVLIVREGLAVGHRGFGGHTTDAALASLVIPLGQPSMFTTAHDERRVVAGSPPPGGLAQSRFLKLFAPLQPAPVAVVPVLVRDRVVNLVFAIAPTSALTAAVTALCDIAAAMGEAYERLIRAAKTKA